MRYENFLQNEIYHLAVSGAGESILFIDDEDRTRFIFLITHFQSPTQIYNINWHTNRFLKKGAFTPTPEKQKLILSGRNVELLSFVILKDQFHLLLRNLAEGITSVYMQRILTAYSKYFNKKYNKRGHVFSGPFRAKKIKNNEELLKISAQFHISAKELVEEKSGDYPWSSYQDYIEINRWGELLSTEPILKHFKNQAEYKKFVESHKPEKLLF